MLLQVFFPWIFSIFFFVFSASIQRFKQRLPLLLLFFDHLPSPRFSISLLFLVSTIIPHQDFSTPFPLNFLDFLSCTPKGDFLPLLSFYLLPASSRFLSTSFTISHLYLLPLRPSRRFRRFVLSQASSSHTFSGRKINFLFSAVHSVFASSFSFSVSLLFLIPRLTNYLPPSHLFSRFPTLSLSPDFFDSLRCIPSVEG